MKTSYMLAFLAMSSAAHADDMKMEPYPTTEGAYFTTTGCVIAALKSLVPEEGREIVQQDPNNISAYSSTNERYVEFIVKLHSTDSGEQTIAEIFHNYADNLSGDEGGTLTYTFSTDAHKSYTGDSYSGESLDEGTYDAQAGVEEMDKRLRACLGMS